ncbi:ECF transporter S component [Enterococcus sp. AZ109]|uniref:ECF transporter S component n=1 Tax=Enterococcus sp. AZ109 TaxID=2774634 RepID=UPI003F1EF36A
MNYSTKRLTTLAILLALCVIGANIKILGSIALDSFPAFIGAIVLGPAAGAFLGFFGHMISALLSGFPNSLPIHLIIAVIMALCMFFYSWTRRKLAKNKLAASAVSMVVAYIINVPLDIVLLYPLMGPGIFVLFVPLTIATVVNLGLSEIVILGIPSKYKEFVSAK